VKRGEHSVSSLLVELPVCRILVLSGDDALTGIIVNPDKKTIFRYANLRKRVKALESALQYFDCYVKGIACTMPPFDLSGYTENERAVLVSLCRVGFGKTVSYGELAEQAGLPGAARFVGSVMRKNRFPIIIPCHRVILSSGKMGNYSSGGTEMKCRLLDFEKSLCGVR
jgi:O-6-methylguanine DNA methyltransferase